MTNTTKLEILSKWIVPAGIASNYDIFYGNAAPIKYFVPAEDTKEFRKLLMKNQILENFYVCENPYLIPLYCFYVDFDFGKNESIDEDMAEEILEYAIEDVIKGIFFEDNEQVEALKIRVARSTQGLNAHLYTNILVNDESRKLMTKVLQHKIKVQFSLQNIKQVVDGSRGLRMPYSRKIKKGKVIDQYYEFEGKPNQSELSVNGNIYWREHSVYNKGPHVWTNDITEIASLYKIEAKKEKENNDDQRPRLGDKYSFNGREIPITIEVVQKLVDLLPETMYKGYHVWRSVGCALWSLIRENNAEDHKQLLAIFQDWSSKDPKQGEYDEYFTETVFNSRTGEHAIGTLVYAVRQANGAAYREAFPAVAKETTIEELDKAIGLDDVGQDHVEIADEDKPEGYDEDSDNSERKNLFREDMGHAEICFQYMKDRVKITSVEKNKGGGYVWDDTKKLWVARKEAEIRNMIPTILDKVVAAHIKEETDKLVKETSLHKKKDHASTNEALGAVLKKVLRTSHANNVFEQLKTKLYVKGFSTKINREQDFLPIKGGKLINLRTGEVRDRIITDYFNYEVPASYVKSAYPLMAKFMNDITCDDQDLVRFMQEILGYMLTGSVDGRAFFVFWGGGSNGKSTLINLLTKLMGPYCIALAESVMQDLGKDNATGLTPQLVPLKDARVGIQSEPKDYGLNQAQIKKISGGDQLSARGIYGEMMEFYSQTKLVMLTNPKPKFNTADVAFIDRLVFVPFNARFMDNPKEGERLKDLDFIKRLTESLDEVFSWMVDGAIRWYAGGCKINTPAVVKNATKELVKELDSVAVWTNDYLESAKDEVTLSSELWNDYLKFCEATGPKPDSKKDWRDKMVKKYGADSKRVPTKYPNKKGYICFSGVRIKEDKEEKLEEDKQCPAAPSF